MKLLSVSLLLLLVLLPSPSNASCTYVTPESNLQSLVQNAPPYTAFCLSAGVYANTTIFPRDGQQFYGSGSTVFSGAQRLLNPVGSSPWIYNAIYPSTFSPEYCSEAEPECGYANDIFVNNVRQHHASRVQDVAEGSYFVDGEHTLYLGTNPTNRVVEMSVTSFAFLDVGNVKDVVITGITIEKYASFGNQAAVHSPHGTAWTFTNNVVRLNHAVGLYVGTSSFVQSNAFLWNGQSGVNVSESSYILISQNELAFNGQLFHPYWAAAGLKGALLTDSYFVQNYAHNNFGFGLWCDIDCFNIFFDSNTCDDNTYSGILYEISFSGHIHNNIVRRNGRGAPTGAVQAGILIAASAEVEVSFNTVSDNVWGIIGLQQLRGPSITYPGRRWEIDNLLVHDNTIRVPVFGLIGLWQEVGDMSYFTSRGNRFYQNTYLLQTSDVDFLWAGGPWRSFAAWQAVGNDLTGSVKVY